MRWHGVAQKAIIALIRPYMRYELPGWGSIGRFVDYRWDWLWSDAPAITMREKMHGNLMRLRLSQWSDRANYFLGRWYDLEIQLFAADFIRLGDTVIDVGAHRGEFMLGASKLVGQSGKVICFEPNPESVAILTKDVELNAIRNATLNQCGLADREETLMLTIDRGIGTFGLPASDGDHPTIPVPVYCGDNFLAEETPALIKIDVEGFEVKVIQGMRNTIKRCSPVIITEIDSGLLEKSGSSVEELISVMTALDYVGFTLGLRRNGVRHTWQLTQLDDTTNCDAVWLSVDHAAKLKNTGRVPLDTKSRSTGSKLRPSMARSLFKKDGSQRLCRSREIDFK